MEHTDEDRISYKIAPDTTLKVSLSDEEILQFISDLKSLPKTYEKDFTGTFFYRQRFYLLLFFSEVGNKGFVLFRVDDYRDGNHDKEYETIKAVLAKIHPGKKHWLRDQALQLVEFTELAVKAAQIFDEGTFIDPRWN